MQVNHTIQLNMKIQATIKRILPLETITTSGGKSYDKQIVVIETEAQYPKTIALTFFGKSQPLVNALSENDKGEFHIDLESREYNGKYYHEIQCFKCEINSTPF
jgi:hypothetical protein